MNVEFREYIFVPELHRLEDTLGFSFEDETVSLQLRSVRPEEAGRFPGRALLGELRMHKAAPEKSQHVLESLMVHRLPEGVDPALLPAGRYEQLATDGLGDFRLPLASLPESARDFFTRAHNALSDSAQRLLGLISWRENLTIPPYYERLGVPEWSLDGADWRRVPTNVKEMFVGYPNVLDITAPTHLNDLFTDKAPAEEPLANALWREAWNTLYSNPRSALVVGVIALETGVKQLIGDLIPQAEWLVFNVPSPPVVSILEDYIPRLKLRGLQEGKPLQIPRSITDVCKKWITQRNAVTHGKRSQVRRDELVEFLLLVRDLLRLFEYSSKHEWALGFIRSETLEKLRGDEVRAG